MGSKHCQWIMLSAVIALTGAPAARADLQFSVQPVAASPGDVNDTLEVDATNTGSSVVDLAAFAFEINTLSSDIEFQQSTTATGLAPYVFAGNSLVDTYFGGVNSIDGPGQTLDVSDVVLTPNTFADIAAGATVGLGEISFNVAPDALDGLDAIELQPGADQRFRSVRKCHPARFLQWRDHRDHRTRAIRLGTNAAGDRSRRFFDGQTISGPVGHHFGKSQTKTLESRRADSAPHRRTYCAGAVAGGAAGAVCCCCVVFSPSSGSVAVAGS